MTDFSKSDSATVTALLLLQISPNQPLPYYVYCAPVSHAKLLVSDNPRLKYSCKKEDNATLYIHAISAHADESRQHKSITDHRAYTLCYVTYANREDMDFSTQISSNYLVLIGDGDTIIWFEWQY